MDKDLDLEVRAHSLKDYFEENKKAKDIIAWIWNEFLTAEGKKIGKRLLLIMLIIQFTVVANSYSVRFIFDGVIQKDNNTLLLGLISFSFLLYSVRFLNRKKGILREYFFADFGARLNERVNELFFSKSLGVHIGENNILNESNIKKGYDRVFDLVYILFFEVIETVVNLIFAYILLGFTNSLILGIITIMVTMYLVWSGYLNYQAMVVGYPIEKKWRHLYRYRTERWQNVERVKNNAKHGEELQEMNDLYKNAIEPDLNLWIWFVKSGFARGIIAASIFLIGIIYGIREVVIGNLSPGWLYPIIALSTQILDNLWRVGDYERKIHYNLHSIGIMKEALELPAGLAVKERMTKLGGDEPPRIEFEAVSYRFGENGGPPAVFEEISFTIEPNDKVALIGKSGAGKTTLMRLLLRYMDPIKGSIKINGHDLRDIDLESWLGMVGYISQQPNVLNGTIRYNALYGVPQTRIADIPHDYLWGQARMLQVDFGERLIDGLETRIGYNGIKLSGGQNQRLMILAAAMKNPKFMIIDEATSSLDSSTERLVQQGLERVLDRNCGALIIAHRLSTVRRICNKFIMIEPINGSGSQIVGIGKNFEELFESCPQFRKLAEDQEIKI